MDEVRGIFGIGTLLEAKAYCQCMSLVTTMFDRNIDNHCLPGGKFDDSRNEVKLTQFLGNTLQNSQATGVLPT